MTNDKDKILLRAKDIGMLVLLFTLLGFLVGPMRKYFEVEHVISDIEELKKEQRVDHDSVISVNAKFDEIQKQLESINWQLRRIGHERDS